MNQAACMQTRNFAKPFALLLSSIASPDMSGSNSGEFSAMMRKATGVSVRRNAPESRTGRFRLFYSKTKPPINAKWL
jgi:hypothetical protein